jgi:UDP-N-acetylmuramoyl-tripeptide--D-alanyl-D-alanine ligase
VRFTAEQIATITDGRVVGDPTATVDGATQDSRDVQPGQLFVPLVAERDGHDFVDVAVASGATVHLTQHEATARGATAVVVDDTAAALEALGAAARARMDVPVVGITGSVGKTTVKDLALGVLGAAGPVHGSARSFNNEIGVPLTLLATPDGATAVVVEMGARGLGHIRHLCGIARPTIGVVTRVAMVHSELFGSIDDIARGKGELVEALPPSGTAVLNAGDERVAAMAARTPATVLTYGVGLGDVRVERVDVADDLRLRVALVTPWGHVEVEPSARGAHNAENAAAAAAVGLATGMDLDAVAVGLGRAELSPLRMSVDTHPSGATILDDTYNANPTSMRAALDALAALPAARRVAVLGVMAELGPESDAEHAAIGAEVVERGMELVTVAAPQYEAERHGGIAVGDVDAAVAAIGALDTDTAMLAKGSRVAGLDELVRRLLGT